MNDLLVHFVRDLIKKREITLARNIVSIVESEYPFLKFEVEIAAGNYKTAMEIYKKLPENYKTLYNVQDYEKKAENFPTEDFETVIETISSENYTSSVILLEELKKEFPEVVEAIALELEAARRKGDKKRAKELSKILEQIDKTHPGLLKKETDSKPNIVIMSLLIVIITISLIALFNPIILSLNKEITNVKANLDYLETELSNKTAIVSNKMDSLKTLVTTKMDDLKSDMENTIKTTFSTEKLENVINNQFAEFNKKLSDQKFLLNSLSERVVELSLSISNLERNVKNMKLQVSLTPPTPTELEKFLPTPRNTQMLRVFWLLGYQYYKIKNYKLALELIDKVIESSSGLNLYFIDDAFYYRALIYYEMGDIENAYILFKDFVLRFPDSLYTPHAHYFINKLGG
ncbi:tetratricopeptide repeat protein [Thermosipho ferrireducens]|uniref:Tetratricopeptide repeat protein n=1 Tax=Thermosipho ferrireducens TaxID=2571116 RepID=A0ABX7S5B1_9BACT|nr:tetratricopeptide repeat protein [Thermosipho ferrireducens]QTA37708.1 tetratricopeptide repeat protein [Thermosipho ferrireducens]